MKRRIRWPRFLDLETPIEAVQPDYAKWQAVRIGMTRHEVTSLLGSPQADSDTGPKDTYSTYGHLQFPLMPHPRLYIFLLGFDEQDRVFTKTDPFGGIFSADAKDIHAAGRGDFFALPANRRFEMVSRIRFLSDQLRNRNWIWIGNERSVFRPSN
jgi:hypothetical protein